MGRHVVVGKQRAQVAGALSLNRCGGAGWRARRHPDRWWKKSLRKIRGLPQQLLEKAAAVEPEQESRHVAGVLLGDAAVVGIEHRAGAPRMAMSQSRNRAASGIDVAGPNSPWRAVSSISCTTRATSMPASGSQRCDGLARQSAERASLSLRPAS